MYITINKKYSLKLAILLIIILHVVDSSTAQISYVRPTQPTVLYTTQASLYAFVAGGLSNNSHFRTANSNLFIKDVNFYGTFFNVGLATEIFNTKCSWLRYGGALGYKYQMYQYKEDLFTYAGVFSHWLTMDISAIIKYEYLEFLSGLSSDILLGSAIRNIDNFTYNGLNGNCFNAGNLSWYAGIMIVLSRVKLEARLGTSIIPQLSPQKISYYNFHQTSIDGFFFEMRAHYCFFTTGKP